MCLCLSPETQSIGIHDVFNCLHGLHCIVGRFSDMAACGAERIFVDVFWPIFLVMKAKQDQINCFLTLIYCVTDFMAKLELKKQVSQPGEW